MHVKPQCLWNWSCASMNIGSFICILFYRNKKPCAFILDVCRLVVAKPQNNERSQFRSSEWSLEPFILSEILLYIYPNIIYYFVLKRTLEILTRRYWRSASWRPKDCIRFLKSASTFSCFDFICSAVLIKLHADIALDIWFPVCE